MITDDKVGLAIQSIEYGIPYNGDLTRDTLDMLRNYGRMEAQHVEAIEQIDEITSQLPDEDFLDEIIDEITDAVNSKLTKSEMVLKLQKLMTQLEDVKTVQVHATEYAFSVARTLKISANI